MELSSKHQWNPEYSIQLPLKLLQLDRKNYQIYIGHYQSYLNSSLPPPHLVLKQFTQYFPILFCFYKTPFDDWLS